MAKRKRIEHHPIIKAFGATLRIERKRRGLSQQDLAFKAGVNVGYVGKLERGESAVGLDLIARLADTLDVAPEKLLSGQRLSGDDSLAKAGADLLDKVQRLIRRSDLAAIHSLMVVVSLMDGALARNLKTS
jgi:transcriptional regulator with XRE-family HTH domain